jgi:flavin-dependent dehydrogenase
MSAAKLDVAILGGGMAGNLLARQLARRLPGRRIGVFEKKRAHTYNVGESMVEIASHYFVRRLGLSSYLYDRQYPKNGLRFFFDTPERDAKLHEMSEIGSASLPFHPAFQIDRSRLETDLIEMNLRDGVHVHLGTRVTDLELARDGRAHRFAVADDSGRREIECRWLVDASGRSRLLARREGLDVPERELTNAAVWGWFEGVTDVDSCGPASFRARVRHTARRLSTLHFMYRGYWIWFIPLKEGKTSIGVVCEKQHFDPRMRSRDGLLDFLRRHAAVRSLLENAKPIATQGYPQLAYGTRRFFSPERWALTGEAAAFPDPFYSPGSDFIALANDFIADLIARDLSGESEATLRDRSQRYDAFMRFRFEAAMRLYRHHYPFFGSFELCKLKWDLDIGCYYNLWTAQYMGDEHLNGRALRRQLRQRDAVLHALDNFTALFQKLDAHLLETGRYHRRNRGAYNDGQDCLGFMREVGLPRSEEAVLARTEQIFNQVRDRALDLLCDAAGTTQRERKPLAWFLEPRALDA